MFKHTDTKHSPWWTVEADDKRRARLNCVSHILGSVPYRDLIPPALNLPKRRQRKGGYRRPPKSHQNYVPDVKV